MCNVGGGERCWVCDIGKDEDAVIKLGDEVMDLGMRRTLKMNDPKEPNAEERKEHAKTHLPFRSWCRHCVGGRGKHAAHWKQARAT